MTTAANATPAGYQAEATFTEGDEIRICEQTASRDYTAKIVPGTYPVRYTTVGYHPFREGVGERRPYYACIDVEIDTPTRTQSSVEFGGVALASETIQGARKPYTIVRYAYQMTED